MNCALIAESGLLGPKGLANASVNRAKKKTEFDIAGVHQGCIKTCLYDVLFCFEGRRVFSAWHMLIKMG
jgi:hypothetical protein